MIGGFTSEICDLLEKKPSLIREIANMIITLHFPESIHEDIIEAVGLDLASTYETIRKTRDHRFRERILIAYQYSCAICAYNVRLGRDLVALESAHIKWHQAGGPDGESNGIALCSLHHKLFDRGVFTLTQDRKIIVAEEANGTNGLDEWLMRYHKKEYRGPIRDDYKPRESFIAWHNKEVFRGKART